MTGPRDYVGEMRNLIDKETAKGPYIPPVLATEIVTNLRATDPALLAGWLSDQAIQAVRQMINDIDRSKRSHARYADPRSAFAASAQEYADAKERGEPEPQEKLRDFLGLRFTVGDGSRRELGTFTAADLGFVADDYESRERKNAMMKAVMRALAKKVGATTVADHYTNEQLAEMFDSLR